MYQQRLRPFAQVDMILWKSIPSDWQRQFSGDHLMILLDEKGVEWTSIEFAQRIREWQEDPESKRLVLLLAPHSDLKTHSVNFRVKF